MRAIDTEEAARRLARVILSDIDLYLRERPKQGESRDAQIEEGRRLFASRVSPELLPIFGLVLEDRARGPAASAPVTPPPQPFIAVVDDEPTLVSSVAASAAQEAPSPAIEEALPAAVEEEPPPPAEDEPTPVPVVAEAPPPALEQPALVASAPAAPPAAQAPVMVAQAPPVAAPVREMPAPVLTARISFPRLLALVCAAAATIAIVHHFLP